MIDTQGLLKSALLTRMADGLRCGYSREAAREPLAAWFYDCRYAISKTAHAVERNRWLATAAAGYVPDLPRCAMACISSKSSRPHLTACCSPPPVATTSFGPRRTGRRWGKRWLPQACAACCRPARRANANAPAGLPPPSPARSWPPSSLTALARLIGSAAEIVGVDTGLTHLAAALDRPVVALYVATEPGLTGVYAGPQAINLGGTGQCPAPTGACDIAAAAGKTMTAHTGAPAAFAATARRHACPCLLHRICA